MRSATTGLILTLSVVSFLLITACSQPAAKDQARLFKEDLNFLQAKTGVIVLSTRDGQAMVAVNPDIQGRVMTSTTKGPEGLSLGWINQELIGSGQNNIHMNAFGGEDRFWLGPEGGQFSLFFKNGSPFDLDHWFTPPPINEGSFELVSKDRNQVVLKKEMNLTNYANFEFKIRVDRTIRLLDKNQLELLGLPLTDNLDWVAFESDNRITNAGDLPWTKENGLVSIWILGMFNPSPATTVVVPFKPGPESELGPVVHDTYFGKIPPERLKITDKVIYFKGDGQYRSKLGIPPRRALPFFGSYDSIHQVLTIVHYSLPENPADYINSLWEIQENPYDGDVVNAYNDGPTAPGAKSLGSFYELETSSPGAVLNPGESLSHIHTTIHLQGEEKDLEPIAKKILGVSLEEIKRAFKSE